MEKEKTLIAMVYSGGEVQLISVTDEQLKFLKWLDNKYFLKEDLFIDYEVYIEEDFNE